MTNHSIGFAIVVFWAIIRGEQTSPGPRAAATFRLGGAVGDQRLKIAFSDAPNAMVNGDLPFAF